MKNEEKENSIKIMIITVSFVSVANLCQRFKHCGKALTEVAATPIVIMLNENMLLRPKANRQQPRAK
ncbi:MAG: hypothetical protein AB8F95_03575 [Bacteroidia bacterium]